MTACTEVNSKTENIVNKTETKNTDNSTESIIIETTEKEPITTAKLEDEVIEETSTANKQYGFFSGISNHYKEYIKGLDHLSKMEFNLYTENSGVYKITEREELFNAWDKELNKIYSLLMDKLSTGDVEKLKNEERLWIKERDDNANDKKLSGEDTAVTSYYYVLFTETKKRTLELVHLYFSLDRDPDQENIAAMEAYNTVLQNKAQFFDVLNKKDLYLEEFYKELYREMYLQGSSQFEDIISELFFTVVDLDGDGVFEVILSMKDYGDLILILHYEEGTIYGYGSFGVREMGDIKTDGSHRWSAGGGYYGTSKMQLFGIFYNFIELASIEETLDNEGNYIKTDYIIDNKAVTETEFDDFFKAYNRKENVIWYDFNDANISSQITFN